MSSPRLFLLVSPVLAVSLALVVGAASPAAAAPPVGTFGSQVSACAQMSTGFSGQHNPSHHVGPTAMHTVSGTHC